MTANFDRVFWLGDFNFRVTLERSQVDGLLEKYKDQEHPECKVSTLKLFSNWSFHYLSLNFRRTDVLRTYEQNTF